MWGQWTIFLALHMQNAVSFKNYNYGNTQVNLHLKVCEMLFNLCSSSWFTI